MSMLALFFVPCNIESLKMMLNLQFIFRSFTCCSEFLQQLYSLYISAAVQVARICMGDDRLDGPCTCDLGVALSVDVLAGFQGPSKLACHPPMQILAT